MKTTPLFRRGVTASGLAALALCLLGGCDKRELSVARPATVGDIFALTADWPAFAQTPGSKVDILFMIDDSSSMSPQQLKLTAAFQVFTSSLEGLPGGTPDLHIGVVSSSMGAGRNVSIDHCPPGGDVVGTPDADGGITRRASMAGALHNLPVGSTCAQTTLTDHFLAVHTDAASGQLVTNYGAASLADAFGCIAALGDGGCGFEHQLGSVRHALDPALAPAVNAGFLRADAFLAVILVTNEDDCSAPDDSDLFDSSPASISDPLGPLQSYRCNEFGHLCLIDGKLQHPPRTMATGDLQGCRSAEDGRLDEVSDFVTFLKNLKGDPARVVLAAITGPAAPYVVGLGPSLIKGDGTQWPFIRHSCTSADGTYADPAVRIAQAVTAFGGQGLLSNICDDTMGPALQEILKRLSRPLAAPCVATPDPAGPGCTVVDRWIDDGGSPAAARLPSCAATGGATPCWRLVDDDAVCVAGTQRLVVDRGTATTTSSLLTAIDCAAPHP